MLNIYFILALLIVITFHEFAHAYAAYKLGDPTAKYEGRVSLNPLRHLDIMGTIMLVLVGFGWGKPVPVNPNNFKNKRLSNALVAFAGPATNLLIAICIAIPLKYLPPEAIFLNNLSYAIFQLSIVLFLFNMIPFPPLDGSNILALFIPNKYHNLYDLWWMQEGVKYFILFIIVDQMILGKFLNFSLLRLFIENAYALISSIILIGT